MIQANRRRFLCQTSVAAAAALAIVPSFARPGSVSPSQTSLEAAEALSEPLAAYVRDAKTGEIAVFIGSREVIIRDLGLVAQLVHATR